MQIWEYGLWNAYHCYTIVKSKRPKLGTVCRGVQWSLNFQKESEAGLETPVPSESRTSVAALSLTVLTSDNLLNNGP